MLSSFEWRKQMFLATIADGKQLLHGEKDEKLQKLTSSPLLDGPWPLLKV